MVNRFFETMNDNAILPKRGTARSAGYDLYVPKNTYYAIKPGESKMIKLGVRAFMQPDEVLLVYIRSSIGIKKNLVLSNGTGVIDSDYYANPTNGGEICVCLRNEGTEDQIIYGEDRIAQAIFTKYLIVDNDNTINERIGGIGSTNQ